MNQGELPSGRTRQVIALGITQTIAWVLLLALGAVLALDRHPLNQPSSPDTEGRR